MSPGHEALGPALGSFPRVSGDEPILRVLDGKAGVFSPRERG